MNAVDPISTALEADVRTAVRRHGVVLWLDADAHYTDLVDQLIAARQAGDLPYAVEAFRGSHLALMLALEPHATGPTPTPLLPDRVGELSGTSTISGNDEDRIHVVMGNNDRVSWDATWKDLGVPYDVVDRFFVEAALRLDPGVTLEFAQDGQLIVDEAGSFAADGTAEAPVTLTGTSEQASGFWVGLQIESNTSANRLSHTRLSFTGSDTWSGDPESDAALFVADGAMLSLEDVEIGPGGGYGIYLATDASQLGCEGVTFTGLEDGAIYDDSTSSILPGC